MNQRYKLDYSVIGRRIAQGRRILGITQKELAQLVHITSNQIAKLETNKAAASLETIVNIANVLQLDINALLMSEEILKPEDFIDLLLISKLKDFNLMEKEALLSVINAMRTCKGLSIEAEASTSNISKQQDEE